MAKICQISAQICQILETLVRFRIFWWLCLFTNIGRYITDLIEISVEFYFFLPWDRKFYFDFFFFEMVTSSSKKHKQCNKQWTIKHPMKTKWKILQRTPKDNTTLNNHHQNKVKSTEFVIEVMTAFSFRRIVCYFTVFLTDPFLPIKEIGNKNLHFLTIFYLTFSSYTRDSLSLPPCVHTHKTTPYPQIFRPVIEWYICHSLVWACWNSN